MAPVNGVPASVGATFPATEGAHPRRGFPPEGAAGASFNKCSRNIDGAMRLTGEHPGWLPDTITETSRMFPSVPTLCIDPNACAD